MNFLFDARSHFNLANLFTMMNITAGLVAAYLVTQHQFAWAALFAWVGGAFDIFDGKIARKYGLSNEFGVQLDSFADFLTFVLVPVFFIFVGVYEKMEGVWFALGAVAVVYYVISGLRRLIQFNIDASPGNVGKYFVGVPTPLGAILLWLVWLGNLYGLIPDGAVIALMFLTGWLLNSRVKVPHP
ncbi:CDP-alcohol phosphatidyltransferase family protein [Hydrogenimonas sp. SS33]|uniref:CDP-alcohol phosphatidyltransferase family protein n=1 Tax=Hydrogenimonas leucolamina TaxID=2954236 RepID=UPI00336C2657